MPEDIIDLSQAQSKKDIEDAHRILLEKQLVLSANRYQAKLCWTLIPWTRGELTQRVEAGGGAPFRVLEMMPLERRAIQWAGAPMWAQYCYLLLVEVKAINVG